MDENSSYKNSICVIRDAISPFNIEKAAFELAMSLTFSFASMAQMAV